jgi:hypothetical protein
LFRVTKTWIPMPLPGPRIHEDHRHLMRGLLRLKKALQRDDLCEARRIGEELLRFTLELRTVHRT